MEKYLVIRYHVGDKDYYEGDIRTARKIDVSHLIGTCLEPISNKKAAKPVKNKAAKPVKNKAAKPVKNKAAKPVKNKAAKPVKNKAM